LMIALKAKMVILDKRVDMLLKIKSFVEGIVVPPKAPQHQISQEVSRNASYSSRKMQQQLSYT
jgi:hypothetical protein